MLTKGHDFHNLTLVVGLNLDSGLYSYDFRAMEYLFVQLMQVSGRAGRGNKVGEVLLQTRYPEHELYQFLIRHDFSGFANYLLKQRKLLLLPPYVYYALFRVSSRTLKYTMNFLNNLYQMLCEQKVVGIEVLEPVPSVIQKLNKKERGQLLIYSQNRKSLHQFLNLVLPKISQITHKRELSWSIDIDPIDM
jgi:primosomal protein N' (replication factor Y)